MSVRPVLRIGHPLLLQAAQAVRQFSTPSLHALVQDLFDTMRATDGAGIAATQIGVMQRVVVFGFEHNERYPDRDAVPVTVLINPEITVLDDTLEEDWEGCLSVPGMRGLVARPRRIRYRGFDAEGRVVEREADGFHARLVQHECDHLDGILYPQRITDMRRFGFEEELFDEHPEVEDAC